ncbi:MAG TPA: hypothetical protein PKX12_17195, partial [Spirochaetota bacterium]|nr:hypothetical protein [Spirochaetota bacterium]
MNKSWIFYISFFLCTILHASLSNRDMEHLCQAETLKQQDVPGHTVSNNAAEAPKTTDARVSAGTQDGTGLNINANTPVNTEAKINADT